MCNLYDIGPARHAPLNAWELTVVGAVETLEKPFGIRKTDPGLVVSLGDSLPVAEIRRWGFERHYNPAVNNARSDKLDGPWSLPWRNKQRCLIPLSTWYEWNGPPGAKQTFAFQSQQRDELLWAAGLLEDRDSGPTYTMITREASPTLAFVHPRMPALLEPAAFDVFFNAEDPRDLFNAPVAELSVFRCLNPLHHLSRHQGPEEMEMLPGF